MRALKRKQQDSAELLEEREFVVTWHADDGYAGGDRPQRFKIERGDLSGDETPDELSVMFWDSVNDDFNEKITPKSQQEGEFIAWAQEQIDSMNRGED